MRVVIACGGTGGHLFPGLAVAQTLKDRGHELLLLVSEKAIDAQALKAHPDFRSEKLPSVGLPSVLSPAFIKFVSRTWESIGQCKQIYRKFRPDAVLGMGGFTSTAPLLAGRLTKIPTFIHESNSIPGKANKLAARFVDRVLIGFDACEQFFPAGKCSVVGTPVRKDLGARIPREEALQIFQLDPNRRTLLVMGGSQGAAGINQLLYKAAPLLRDANLQLIHLTGEREDRLAAANYLREEVPAYVAPFHHRMQEVYSAADLVVSRAGAASLSELSHFALPSILVPYPHAAENHQETNADIFVEAGAAEKFLESGTTPDQLARRITDLLTDDTARAHMAAAAKAAAPDDAAAKVADVIEETVRAKTR
ncbi:MAG TPA: undecaprenyldiphospho-muramoylpentapeptide beta-N-acetylglucosaminyltransferase [Chthoniobacterales bacterium]|jgi:UDP-N-acetylglucosamine--N-acetylmuramyl-(pentapeptide) pyrophosphoryl-undecaprenol N-acetylglucosamine transferase